MVVEAKRRKEFLSFERSRVLSIEKQWKQLCYKRVKFKGFIFIHQFLVALISNIDSRHTSSAGVLLKSACRISMDRSLIPEAT